MPEISAELVDKMAAIATAIHDFVATVRQVEEPLSDDIAAQVADRVRRGVCLQCQTPLANEKRVTRGLCQAHYTTSMQRIRRGQITERWLIMNGFILAESSKGGRKPKRPDPVGEMLAAREAVKAAEHPLVEKALEEASDLEEKKRRKRKQ